MPPKNYSLAKGIMDRETGSGSRQPKPTTQSFEPERIKEQTRYLNANIRQGAIRAMNDFRDKPVNPQMYPYQSFLKLNYDPRDPLQRPYYFRNDNN
jgi:hypothetical protein